MRSANPEAANFELSYYEALPSISLRYEEFKKHASDRFQVLQQLDRKAAVRHTDISLKKDLLEHACLQLVCCQNVSSSIFFVNNETMLFRYRVEANPRAALLFFHELVWPHLNPGISSVNSAELLTGGECAIGADTFYDPEYTNSRKYPSSGKIHFTKCSDMLVRREHKIEKGYFNSASPAIIKSFMINEFKRVVTGRIEALEKFIAHSREDRFLRLNRELFSRGPTGGKPVPDALSHEESFPLCIQGTIEKLKSAGHLKYADRQALCLFLKDIGLPLEKTVEYFRKHFKCSYEQFNKEYLYSIRHNYGLEGRRADYGSFTCNKLIGMAVDPNAFGCPFVRNKEFVRRYADIEDFGRNALGCCAKACSIMTGCSIPPAFTTPAEYFRLAGKPKNMSEPQ